MRQISAINLELLPISATVRPFSGPNPYSSSGLWRTLLILRTAASFPTSLHIEITANRHGFGNHKLAFGPFVFSHTTRHITASSTFRGTL